MHTTTVTPLSDAITGRTVFPGHADWDIARQAFDLLVDQRPDAVVFPANERDVAISHHNQR
ncbi:MAG: hypothetical protein ACRDNG_05725 [Gaiellaceae bacterium]